MSTRFRFITWGSSSDWQPGCFVCLKRPWNFLSLLQPFSVLSIHFWRRQSLSLLLPCDLSLLCNMSSVHVRPYLPVCGSAYQRIRGLKPSVSRELPAYWQINPFDQPLGDIPVKQVAYKHALMPARTSHLPLSSSCSNLFQVPLDLCLEDVL